MLTKFEIEAVERDLALLERIAKALENLVREDRPCRRCNPGLSNTTEIVDGNTRCPMCGRKLGKEDA